MPERPMAEHDQRPTLDYLRHAAGLSRTDRALIEIRQIDGRRPLTEIASVSSRRRSRAFAS